MQFYHSITPFGKYERHTLTNDAGDKAYIVPEHGACLTGLEFGRLSVLDGYDTPEQLEENKWSKSALLFPFPNRLRDGKYTWDGKTYQFPINNVATANAIHGFGKTAVMTFESIEQVEDGILLTCVYRHDEAAETWANYPFAVTFRALFRLGMHNLVVSLIAESEMLTGTAPVGLGWHPYFRIAPTANETALQMPTPAYLLDIDERMLPTGKQSLYEDFETQTSIGDTNLDNGFLVYDESDATKHAPHVVTTLLRSEDGLLAINQIAGAGYANYLQVFTPPHRRSIAVEPMTCNIDALNNHDGLATLQQGEKVGLHVHLAWYKNNDNA